MNKKMLPQLSRRGDSRIGQRGVFSPTALLNSYNEVAATAADNLRQLVNQTYPDRVEEVKSLIRDRLDSADIPDADENSTLAEATESLTAIAKFYNQVAGEITAGTFELPQTELETIYEMAKEAIKNKQQWTAGETVTVWAGKTYTAYISEDGRDGGGLLYLGIGKAGQPLEIVTGHLNPLKGWEFTLARQDYDAWTRNVKRTIKLAPAPSWQPDLVMDFGKADWSQSRESHLSPKYAKQARRARDLR